MSKLVAFMLLIFLLGITLTGMADSGGGALATSLTANLTDSATTINVVSTENFLSQDYIFIENEQILYASKTATTFEGCTRGANDTDAVPHNAKKNAQGVSVYPMAYNSPANIINTALNANISAIAANSGWFAIVTVPVKFFTSIPNIIASIGNSPFLQGDMAIVGWVFLICFAGIMVSIAMGMLWVAANIIKIF